MNALERRNNALILNNPGNTVNGKTAQIALTTHGSDWYFAVCAVMTLSGFIFMGLAMRKPRKHRAFNYITSAVVFTAAIAYWSMASHVSTLVSFFKTSLTYLIMPARIYAHQR